MEYWLIGILTPIVHGEFLDFMAEISYVMAEIWGVMVSFFGTMGEILMLWCHFSITCECYKVVKSV